MTSSDAPDKPPLLSEMLRGFPPIESLADARRLRPRDRLRLLVAKALVELRRWRQWPDRSPRWEQGALPRELAAMRDLPMRVPNTAPPDTPAAGFQRAFLRDGILGPFRSMSASAALCLAAEARRLHRGAFDRDFLLGAAVKDRLKQHRDWTINYSGLYQAQRHRSLFDLVTNPAIVARLRALQGPELICWRSQFFEKPPGSGGTFWHQNSYFREGSRARKLRPRRPGDPQLISLTAWTALTPSTIANGALRFLPGSFTDGRLEHLYEYAQDHLLDLLSQQDRATVDRGLRVLLFSSGSFQRAQVVFHLILPLIRDLFSGDLRERTLEMEAGQTVIFTSANLHGSHPCATTQAPRLAFAARYTHASTAVYPKTTTDHFMTAGGRVSFDVGRLRCIRVSGTGRDDPNRSIARPPAWR